MSRIKSLRSAVTIIGVEGFAGSVLGETLEEMKELAQQLDCPVAIKFNGKWLVVEKDSGIEEVELEYWTKSHRTGEPR